MYGIIGNITTHPGRREEFIAILLKSTTKMPGCISYVIARDAADPDTVWVTEVWDSKESHDASLTLPEVRDAITQARPLFASFGKQVITSPVGGYGLTPR